MRCLTGLSDDGSVFLNMIYYTKNILIFVGNFYTKLLTCEIITRIINPVWKSYTSIAYEMLNLFGFYVARLILGGFTFNKAAIRAQVN
jgi:hypothetical protein